MIEELKQINVTKKETMLDFKSSLIKRLKDDDRTRIYNNFICILDEVAIEVIKELTGGI